DYYTHATPNGRKVSIMLEEVGLPYAVHVVDIRKGEQFQPEFQTLNLNGKIPVIVDAEGPDGAPMTVFESGAILIYLAEKTGRFMPSDPRGRSVTLQWLMWQMAGVGPMFGQCHHYRKFVPEPVPYAEKRYTDETRRLYKVMNQRLSGSPYLAGNEYSIADIATFPWVERHEIQGVALEEFPDVARWFEAVAARPAVQRGLRIPG
ncbi:MAG: glutathione S-transferase family protein, partial [Alphaproteobacteria bacterium]